MGAVGGGAFFPTHSLSFPFPTVNSCKPTTSHRRRLRFRQEPLRVM